MSRCLLALTMVLAACAKTQVSGPAMLVRQGRFGSLRDMVLFERAPADGGSFFLDRFEATREDWAGYLAARDGAPAAEQDDIDGVLPALGVDLLQARAFAGWRFSRLPRQDEWWFATTAGGTDIYPWGSVWRPACANTLDLQIWEATPVGTFESGRRGEGPYDLIGNASEWTETVPWTFLWDGPPEEILDKGLRDAKPSQVVTVARMHRRLQRTPGLEVWLRPWSPVPTTWLVAGVDEHVPRQCVGFDFLTEMPPRPVVTLQLAVTRLPRDSDPALGLRLATDPASVLRALCAEPLPLAPADRALLLDFLTRERHRAALAAAFLAVDGELSAAQRRGEVYQLLRSELLP